MDTEKHEILKDRDYYRDAYHAVLKERDALMAELAWVKLCKHCKHYSDNFWEGECQRCSFDEHDKWQWRGLQHE